ncbi:hypothetical protein PHMEG_00010821 [Phytophthora megakarya]|uniref:Uncharacterized protein n=1 Tax=Phytophthora megakarya TaxID=4795 RepID=A0A225WD13_9STRA|nr:hypothetical protein PHMEG_00010821 [Phytophthora megakarya]
MRSWDDSARVVRLCMRLPSALKDWCTELPNENRSNWKALAHVFKKEWFRSVGSKAEQYYGMEMRDQETPRIAGIRFEKPVSEREAHIRRFIRALSDKHTKTTVQGQAFEKMVELERTLKRIEVLRQEETQTMQQKKNPAQNLQFGRFKPPQRRAEGKTSITNSAEVEAESDQYSQPKHDPGYETEEETEEEIKAPPMEFS